MTNIKPAKESNSKVDNLMTDKYSSPIEGAHIVCIAADKDNIAEHQKLASRCYEIISGLMNESGMLHSDLDLLKEILNHTGSSFYVEGTAESMEKVNQALDQAIELLIKSNVEYQKASGILVNLSYRKFPKPSQIRTLVDAVDKRINRLETSVLFNAFEDSNHENSICVSLMLNCA